MKAKFILLFLFSVFCTANVQAKAPEIIVEKNGNVTNYIVKQDPLYLTDQLVEKLSSLPTKEQYKEIDRILEDTANTIPITYIGIADIIYKKDKNKAAFWYATGYLRASEDMHMCVDTTAMAQRQVYPLMAPNTVEYISKKGKKYLNKLLNNALEWDIAHEQRVKPKWACYHGMQAFSGKVKTLPMKKYPEILERVRSQIK